MTNNPESLVETIVTDVAGIEKVGYCVVLETKEEFPRVLQLNIGQGEALHIAQILKNAEQNRPLTNTLLNNIVTLLGAEFVSSQIEDIIAGIFYAKIFYKFEDDTLSCDARASDAIIQAMINKQPVFVSKFVLKTLGFDKVEIHK